MRLIAEGRAVARLEDRSHEAGAQGSGGAVALGVEISDDGGSSWYPTGLSSLPFADDDTDRQGSLPSSLSGTVEIRVTDTDRTPGNSALDTVSIDELFIRSVP